MEEFFELKKQITCIVSLLNQYCSSSSLFVHSDSTRFARKETPFALLSSTSIVHHLFTSFIVIHNKKLYATADIEGLLNIFNKRPR